MKVEEIVTNKIMEALQKGKIPWKKPWLEIAPQNYVTKREYNGINFLLLSLEEAPNPYYLTFNQAKQLGAKIKKGSKGHLVVYWGSYENEDEDEKKHYVPFMRYYNVFNIDQVEGLELPEKPKVVKGKCEEVFSTYAKPPAVSFGGNQAYYSVTKDKVNVPAVQRFNNSDDYYATIFHELIHSTGHPSRLARFTEEAGMFGSETYSKEELVAELGSAFLCAHYGIDNSHIEKSAGYIQNWLQALKNDSSLVIKASGGARKAKDLILGIKDTYKKI